MNHPLDPTKNYSRKANVVYDENNMPVVRFKIYLSDFKNLSADAMNKYYAASPQKFELFNSQETNDHKLVLF